MERVKGNEGERGKRKHREREREIEIIKKIGKTLICKKRKKNLNKIEIKAKNRRVRYNI